MCPPFAVRTSRVPVTGACGYFTIDMECVDECTIFSIIAVCSFWSFELNLLFLVLLYQIGLEKYASYVYIYGLAAALRREQGFIC